MSNTKQFMSLSTALITFIFAGCGGGGGSSTPVNPPSTTTVTVSDAYILEANVTIGGVLFDIEPDDGVYEWTRSLVGDLRSVGGAIDLGEPFGIATETDPKALEMRAPSGYSHINPFTEMLVADINTSKYTAAKAVAGEDGLLFNYDVVKAGISNIEVAKDTAKAALELAGNTVAVPGIDTCLTNTCIDAILLNRLMDLNGAFEPECEKLPGEENCIDPVLSSSSSSSSLSSSSSSSSLSSSSSSSSLSSSSSSTGDPFPVTE